MKYNLLNNKNNQIELNANNTKKINYGLSVLKCLLAFSIVVVHCFNRKSTKNTTILKLTINRLIYAPSFFIISFNFMCYNLLSRKGNILLRRIKRLLIPYIFWPIIIYTINHLLNIKYKKIVPYDLNELKMQLLWGCGYMPQFWFQWDLIIITLVFFLIIFFFNKNYLLILQILLIISYISQYSGYNYNTFFCKYPECNKYTIGRICETIPFAVTGFIFGYYKILSNLEKYRIKTIFLSIVVYNIITNYNIFTNSKGFGYNGIALNIRSICTVFIFYLSSSDKIKNKYLNKVLTKATSYSAGVYYLHPIIYKYFNNFFQHMKQGTFIGIIINYFICNMICFLGIK